VIALPVLIVSAVASSTMLPPSLHKGSLAACAPTTLEAAETCLTHALSAEDLAKLQDKTQANPFRGAIDCEVEVEWHLDDPNSPMAKVMRDKLGIDHPGLAANMIIQDLQMHATGTGLPWDQVRKDVPNLPSGMPRSACPISSVKSPKTELGHAD